MSVTEKSDIRSEDKSKLKEVINQVEEDQQSYEFREPVDWKTLGLTDYPEIIKKPMDLSTLRKNLAKGKYKKYEEFFKDLLLIWDNCKQYNIQGSDIYKQAEHLEKISKKLISKFKEEVGLGSVKTSSGGKSGNKKREETKRNGESDGEGDGNGDEDEDIEEVPFERKVHFTEKVRRLTNEGLTRLVKKVKEVCPKALEDVDDQKLHIKVDEIDKDSFEQLDKLVDENLGKKGGDSGTNRGEEPSKRRPKL
eukprot:403341119